MGMKTLALVLARAGSKGVPGKNVKILGDKPLIAYTIEAALDSRGVDKVVVSTDCPQITEIAKEHVPTRTITKLRVINCSRC